MKNSIVVVLILFSQILLGQSKVERLYQSKKYDEIIALQKSGKVLSGKDLYKVGLSYMKQQNDTAAIRMFEKTIQKGYKTGDVYYKLAIAYNNIEWYKNGVNSCGLALMYVPDRKPYLLEMGSALYQLNDLDSALATYKYIQKMYPENQLSAYMSCLILHEQEKFKKCLECYYDSRGRYKDHNKYYRKTYEAIARIEWHFYNRLDKAESAIVHLVKTYPNITEYKLWLIQLSYLQDKYRSGDSIVSVVQEKYNNGSLNNKYYEKGSMLIDNYEYESFNIEVYQNFDPSKKDSIKYKCFILTRNTQKLLGKMTVKTMKESFEVFYTSRENKQHFFEATNYQNIKKAINLTVLPPPIEEELDSLETIIE